MDVSVLCKINVQLSKPLGISNGYITTVRLRITDKMYDVHRVILLKRVVGMRVSFKPDHRLSATDEFR